MKGLILVAIVVILAVVGCAPAVDEEAVYQDGYDAGYAAGQDSRQGDYDNGYTDGMEDGYWDGYADVVNHYRENMWQEIPTKCYAFVNTEIGSIPCNVKTNSGRSLMRYLWRGLDFRYVMTD